MPFSRNAYKLYKTLEKELIINASTEDVEIALLERKKLVEIHKQKANNNFAVGDIFLGSIKKLMPGLNAAFVDIGHRKDAFLHYTDLGPQIKSLAKYTKGTITGSLNNHLLENFELLPDNPKNGKIDRVFKRNQPLLVQVLKEPISTKGPRLSCEITVPGRYMVITPFSNIIAVSKKIGNDDERKRLKLLAESIKPKNFGMIIRTAAQGKKVAELHGEVRNLVAKWEKMYTELKASEGPCRLLSEIDKTSSLLRDVLTDSFNKIVVNDKDFHVNVKNFMNEIAPEKAKIVSQYKGKKPIFEAYGVSKQIKTSFGKTATMPSGAYLVIEHTEAMHVIDVNSGPKMKRSDQETASLAVNLESAEEIARQLRLRDIGGLIIIDFIDMRNSENKQSLFRKMKDFMSNDRAQHTILPLSRFGLMQITRQRTRPEVKIDTSEQCPSCNGTGKVNATVVITDEISKSLEYIRSSRPKSKLKLNVHPFVHAYLTKGIKSVQVDWFLSSYKWITIEPKSDYPLTKYIFTDGNNDEIRLD